MSYEILKISIFAVAGGTLLWMERNDKREEIAGIKLGSGFFTAIILLAGACLIREFHTDIYRFGVAFGLFAFIISAPHNLLLSHPKTQRVQKPRDFIQGFIFGIFGKKEEDFLGYGAYTAYSLARYALPISLMGLILDHLPLMLAGPVASILYFPFHDGDSYKRIRAAMLGALLGGVMVV